MDVVFSAIGGILILVGVVFAWNPRLVPGINEVRFGGGLLSVRGGLVPTIMAFGVVLLVVPRILPQPAPAASAAPAALTNTVSAPPTASVSPPTSPALAPRPTLSFSTPDPDSLFHVGHDVHIAGSVLNLNGAKLWFLTRSTNDGDGYYYTISRGATTGDDGEWSIADHRVGGPSDVGGKITYYGIAADPACNTALEQIARTPGEPPVTDLPPTCVVLTGLPLAAVA